MVISERDIRLQHACWFLSLDDTSDFFSELWVPSADPERLKACVRDVLSTYETDSAAYLSDAPRFAYRCLSQFERIFDPDVAQLLDWWIERVYMHHGSDRSAEWTWSLFEGRVRKDEAIARELDSWIVDLFERIRSRKMDLLARFREKLQKRFRMPISDWDRMALVLQGTDREAVSIQIELIVNRNVFDFAWDIAAEGVLLQQLDHLYAVSQRLASSHGLDVQGWAFPGAWRFSLLPFLAQARRIWT